MLFAMWKTEVKLLAQWKEQLITFVIGCINYNNQKGIHNINHDNRGGRIENQRKSI